MSTYLFVLCVLLKYHILYFYLFPSFSLQGEEKDIVVQKVRLHDSPIQQF